MKPKNNQSGWMDTPFREMIRFYWNRRADYKMTALLRIVEVILSVGIAASIAVYLDPDYNIVSFPWNVGAFLILVAMAIWVHRQTRPFRVARKMKKRKFSKKK